METRVGIFVLAAIGVFVYLGFRIGAFRFDRRNFHSYYLACNDIEGLSRKADVKIAGVKVGWVESVTLNQQRCVTVTLMIAKEFSLYHNAYAFIRQEGILGPKYVEIMPGDSNVRLLQPTEYINQSSTPSMSVDEMMKQMHVIMANVNEITISVKELIASTQGRDQLHAILNSVQLTTEKMASFALWMDQPDHKDALHDLLTVGSDIRAISKTLEKSVQEVSSHAQESFKTVNSVAQKIDQGQGCIGKLINDDHAYRDFEYVMNGLKHCFKKFQMMEFVFDSHLEGMFHHAENYRFADAKGYFDMRIYPSEDYFYLFEIVASEKGFAYRKQIDHTYIDHCDRPINPADFDLPDWARFAFQFNERKATYERNTILFGLQFGKIFRDIALRFGIFEGTAGAGIDIDIPFRNDNFRWVTTFELFDIRGWNHRNDRHAHLKWLNRVYLFRNIYTTFGADDFISKHNSRLFFGMGVRFGDDDVKYLFAGI